MAAVAVERAMNLDEQSNHLHPFFSRPKDEIKPPRVVVQPELEEHPSGTDNDAEQGEGPKKRTKRSKKQDTNGQLTILQGFGIKAPAINESGVTGASQELEQRAELEADPNFERRKRRKTTSPGPEDIASGSRALTTGSNEVSGDHEWRQQLHEAASKESTPTDDVPSAAIETSKEHVNGTNAEGTVSAKQSNDENALTTTPPRQSGEEIKPARTMKLKGGKLASPTTQKQEVQKAPRKRGRPSKAAEPASLIVKVRYAEFRSDTQEMGQRIQRILDGTDTYKAHIPLPVPANPKAVVSGPPKAPHPFFSGKPLKKTEALDTAASTGKAEDKTIDLTLSPPRKASATTPGKIRTARDAFRAPTSPSLNRTAVVPSERKKLKHAGDHPAWPTRESAHVRGLDSTVHQDMIDLRTAGFMPKSEKRKMDYGEVASDGSILQPFSHLEISPSILREPQRVTTTGVGLQRLVAEQLSSDLSNSNTHPALTSIYNALETSMSAFDKFECETQAWTQKYAPKCANEVLQIGSEAHILKDWLERSTISAVQTSSKRSTASSTMSLPKSKKRRKRKTEDDFIVESEDEADELNELQPLSDSTRQDANTRSWVRGGDNYKQATPAGCVLLSGPHGSGKTASVYAIAKELGFEVFEINSAVRRSGKDVIDKIGDMTENHLVQQVTKALTEDKPVGVNGKLEAIQIDQPDAPDPKQKSMASFFKAAPPAKKPAPTPKQVLPNSVLKVKGENKPSSRQKQSLILLEEVDVLFEEDKQFWMTVLALTTHSKRPIVMTCNDERYVPVESLTMHAILRFTCPPINLATDYALLIAACEGHILERSSVESLYKTKGHDLRGTITELNFWCQMSVGDRTGGFQWMLDRYPPGIDVDEHGRTLRTASKNTFECGMNVVSRDLTECEGQFSSIKEAMWAQAWDDWHVEVADFYRCSGPYNSVAQSELDFLDAFAFSAEQLSAGDVSFGFGMREPKQQQLDHSLPPLTQKVLASHALGWSFTSNVLNTEPIPDYTSLDKHMAVASELRARRALANLPNDSEHYPSGPVHDIVNAVEATLSLPAHSKLTRNEFSLAFDPLTYDPDDSAPGSASTIFATSFDREFSIIYTDLAPYIRTIAREFQLRGEERLRMSNLLSVGGKKRQTRSAFSALDGGRRSDRRARYFETLGKMGLNVANVFATGGAGWSVRADYQTETNSIVDESEGLKSTQESDAV